ncbi:hypothetical protein [Streptomyces sp. NPDC048481]|uniref:hypothetical protein n=1 Tax=Streptomyces sp. NPDC048481 TaxID=3365557 RepID=UPI003719773A
MGDAPTKRSPCRWAELTCPRRYLHIPRNFSDDDAQIRIDVPVHMRFTEDLVADLIVKKLALENVSFTWRRAGKDTHVIVKKRQGPPKMLRLCDSSLPAAAPTDDAPQSPGQHSPTAGH